MEARKQTPGSTAERRGRSAPRGLRGFAMMDALIGAAILGIVVAGTLQFFQYGQRRMVTQTHEQSAFEFARNQMETIIAAGYDSAASQVDTTYTIGAAPATITTTVTYVDDPADSLGAADSDGINDYKRVVVEVSFGGGASSVSLRTVLIP